MGLADAWECPTSRLPRCPGALGAWGPWGSKHRNRRKGRSLISRLPRGPWALGGLWPREGYRKNKGKGLNLIKVGCPISRPPPPSPSRGPGARRPRHPGALCFFCSGAIVAHPLTLLRREALAASRQGHTPNRSRTLPCKVELPVTGPDTDFGAESDGCENHESSGVSPPPTHLEGVPPRPLLL